MESLFISHLSINKCLAICDHLTLLDKDTIRMLKAAKKHHTHLAAICLTPLLHAEIPAWYHPAAETSPLMTIPAKCLLKNHRNSTVADLILTSARLREPGCLTLHIPNPQCPCTNCSNDHNRECRNPHTCSVEAQSCINLITPKLNPQETGNNHDNLSLTPHRKARNHEARQTNDHIQFNPSVTYKNNLAECFRIFINPNKISTILAQRYHIQDINHQHHEATIYTDGTCHNNGKLNAQCSGGIWFGPNHERNAAIQIPGPLQSNQVGEIAAIIAAAVSIPRFWPLTIISNSKYAIEGLTTHLQTWEDKGWIGVKNTDLFKRAAFLLHSRTATTNFKWVKGHDGNLGNEQSDQLTKEGASKPEEDILLLKIPKEFDLQGAKLATITQSIVYQGIREHQTHTP
jgi:ribonuclease HI